MSSQLWTKETVAELQALTNTTVWRILSWHRDMDDIKQDAMMRLFEQRHKIPAGQSRKRYVCVLVKNIVYQYLRKQYRDPLAFTEPAKSKFKDGDAEAECLIFGMYTPVYADPYLVAGANKVVAEMTPVHQEVIRLKAEEYDYNEIASMLNVSSGTVRSRLHYAKKEGVNKLSQLIR